MKRLSTFASVFLLELGKSHNMYFVRTNLVQPFFPNVIMKHTYHYTHTYFFPGSGGSACCHTREVEGHSHTVHDHFFKQIFRLRDPTNTVFPLAKSSAAPSSHQVFIINKIHIYGTEYALSSFDATLVSG